MVGEAALAIRRVRIQARAKGQGQSGGQNKNVCPLAICDSHGSPVKQSETNYPQIRRFARSFRYTQVHTGVGEDMHGRQLCSCQLDRVSEPTATHAAQRVACDEGRIGRAMMLGWECPRAESMQVQENPHKYLTHPPSTAVNGVVCINRVGL